MIASQTSFTESIVEQAASLARKRRMVGAQRRGNPAGRTGRRIVQREEGVMANLDPRKLMEQAIEIMLVGAGKATRCEVIRS